MYKHLIQNKKAVIFDLDGTIVQTEEMWKRAFVEVLQRNGGKPEAFTGLINQAGVNNGTKWRQIIKEKALETTKSAEELNTETKAAYTKIIDKEEIGITEGFWDLAIFLKIEKEFKLVLNTNTDKEIAEKVLDKIGIDKTFDFKIFGDDVTKPKPDPETYKKALALLHIKPEEALVFEDSPAGATAAVAANIDTIVVWDGMTDKEEYPSKIVMYVPTLEGLANNMTHTAEEAFNEYRQALLDAEKARSG